MNIHSVCKDIFLFVFFMLWSIGRKKTQITTSVSKKSKTIHSNASMRGNIILSSYKLSSCLPMLQNNLWKWICISTYPESQMWRTTSEIKHLWKQHLRSSQSLSRNTASLPTFCKHAINLFTWQLKKIIHWKDVYNQF